MYTSIQNCQSCTLDSDCEDNEACTTNTCLNGACTFTSISNCKTCTLSSQCDDNDSSTTFSCLGGKCTYTKITSCKNNDGYCPSGCNAGNDNDCSYICGNGIREGTEKCDGASLGGATCAGVLGTGYTGTLKCFSGLCTFDTSLCVAPCTCSDDGNICTTDQCVNNVCQHTAISGCCTSASQCNDNNICTTDSCSGNNLCSHSTIASCCTSSSQCGSNQVCTGNVCVATSNPPTATCGDGSCNGGETCSNCSQDCGTCASYSRIFYVNATTGNDNNNGLSSSTPWKTLSKVNSYTTFKAGDAILFRRGDTWYSTLTVTSSGSSTAPITYGAYGTGEKPIITGFTTITGWTNEGGGIYSKVVSTQSAPNMVTVDGVNTWMGRYPDTGWLTYESSGSGYIVDNQLSGSPDWTGAEVVIKKEGYITDRSSITRHSGNTIYYDKSSTVGDEGNAGWGYFIENDIRTLTTLGEWYYDDNTNKFYMYFGAITPTTKIVKVASLNNGVSSSQSYITFDNINIQGFNVGFNLDNSNNAKVTNCEVGFTGGYGVVLGTNNLYDNLYLHDTNADGFSGSSDGFTLTNSIIENIGMIEGSGYGYGGRGSAMDYWGSNALIQYNTFRNIGLVAVGQIGNDVTIDSNFFDNCCAKSFDCGAIYMNNNGGNTNRVVSNNIIINTIGSASGTTETKFPNQWVTAEGIYLDEPCSGVTIEGNSISTINGCGIKLHESHDIIIRDNTIYNAFEGYQFLGSDAQPNDPIRRVDMDNNIVVAMDPSQFIFVFMAHTLNDVNQFGTSNSQYYVRPINDGVMHDFWTNQASDGDWGNFRPWSTANPAPAGTWQAKIGQQDLDSHFSEGLVSSTNDVRFEYNPTKTNKVISLSGSYKDVKGTTYSGSVTLAPYTSIVLVKN